MTDLGMGVAIPVGALLAAAGWLMSRAAVLLLQHDRRITRVETKLGITERERA